MTRLRVLLAAAAGVFFYVLLSFTGGRDGLWAQDQMKAQRRLVSTRTAALQSINDELSLEYAALQNDMDVIASYARKLGYVKEGERLVKVTGLGIQEKGIYDPGQVLKAEKIRYVNEWVCKLFGLIVFALVYAILLLKDLTSVDAHKNPVVRKNADCPAVQTVKASEKNTSAAIVMPVKKQQTPVYEYVDIGSF